MQFLYIDESGTNTIEHVDKFPYFIISIVYVFDKEKLKKVIKKYISKIYAELQKIDDGKMFKNGKFCELKGSSLTPIIKVDYLLGTDKFKNDKITEEIKETFNNYNKKGDNVGCYEYMKKMYEKYPNIEKIQFMYADACFSAYHENNEIIDKGIEILERLIKVSNNNDIKDKAYDKLFWLYLRKKDKVKLKDIFNNNIKPKLKKDYYSSYILEGEELTKYCQQEICNIIGDFWDQLMDIRKNETYPLEEKVKVLDNIEKTLYHIKICSECAIESDKRPNIFKHTSLLFNHIEDNRDYISYSGNTKTYGNQSFTLWNNLQRGDFIKLKGNEEYINLLDELSKYKKQFN